MWYAYICVWVTMLAFEQVPYDWLTFKQSRFSSVFWRSRTRACNDMTSRCWQEQGDCNPSFGSSIRYCMATLFSSEHLKAFECVDAIRCVPPFMRVGPVILFLRSNRCIIFWIIWSYKRGYSLDKSKYCSGWPGLQIGCTRITAYDHQVSRKYVLASAVKQDADLCTFR